MTDAPDPQTPEPKVYWLTRCNQCVLCGVHFQGFITNIHMRGKCPNPECNSPFASRTECRKTRPHGFTPDRKDYEYVGYDFVRKRDGR